jgi:hypothetical protein
MLGNPAISPGFRGNCLQLDGVSVVDFGWARNGCFLTPDLCPSGFTLSVWLYDPGTKSGYNYYITSGGQTTSSYGFALRKDPDGHNTRVKTRSQFYQCQFQIPTQTWTNVLVTWYDDPTNPGDALHVYVDGLSVVTPATVTPMSFSGDSVFNQITFGSPNNLNSTQLFVQASIDEFMFWDERKSANFAFDHYSYWTGG